MRYGLFCNAKNFELSPFAISNFFKYGSFSKRKTRTLEFFIYIKVLIREQMLQNLQQFNARLMRRILRESSLGYLKFICISKMWGFEFSYILSILLRESSELIFVNCSHFEKFPYSENFEIVPLSERKVIRVRLHSGRSSSKPAFRAGISN